MGCEVDWPVGNWDGTPEARACSCSSRKAAWAAGEGGAAGKEAAPRGLAVGERGDSDEAELVDAEEA